MSLLDGPLVFVDIETNGLSHTRGKIIEVAAIRVENGREVKRIESILDPESELPAFISGLTGITRQDFKGAPTFRDIADELYEIMDQAIFVAHNVRFDYSFLKQEFKRLNKTFSPKQLCTVRLSKALYPQHRSHKLDSVIERIGLSPNRRHRAYDDADVLRQFVQHAKDNFSPEILESAIKLQLRTPSLPKALPYQLIKELPDGPGVYIFQDASGSPLYIGKSVNIKKRVMSHFSSDHSVETEFKMSQGVTNVETIETGGELEALILESRLIKDLQPLYNRRLRRNQKMTIVRQILSPSGYITVSTEDTAKIDPERTEDILAVYPTKGRARESLNQIIKDYSLCPKLFGFEKGSGSCFYYQLHKCDGACIGEESSDSYNYRLIQSFERQRIESWPFNNPIVVQEKANGQLSKKSFVIDKWCIIADIRREDDCSPDIRFHDRVFDLDTYKILRSYIRGKMSNLEIQPVSLQFLRQLQNVD